VRRINSAGEFSTNNVMLEEWLDQNGANSKDKAVVRSFVNEELSFA
jgi:hypothetical protein